ERIGTIARSKDRAAAGQEVRDAERRELSILLLVEPLEAVPDADDLPAIGLPGMQGHRADDSVEAGAVAAAGQDPDPRAHLPEVSLVLPRWQICHTRDRPRFTSPDREQAHSRSGHEAARTGTRSRTRNFSGSCARFSGSSSTITPRQLGAPQWQGSAT